MKSSVLLSAKLMILCLMILAVVGVFQPTPADATTCTQQCIAQLSACRAHCTAGAICAQLCQDQFIDCSCGCSGTC